MELALRRIKEDGGIVAARFLYWKNSTGYVGDEKANIFLAFGAATV
jgi:hypothetical protein